MFCATRPWSLPGVLGRQLFDEADLGENKARALAAALDRINPALKVTARTGNVLNSSDLDVDWTDGCDIVIDATVDNRVLKRTEVRRQTQTVDDVPMVTVVIGHTAEHGLMTFTPAGSVNGSASIGRLAKIAIVRDPRLREFADEFWPVTPCTDLFTPEPGCSEPTFTGGGSEVVALAATMLHAAARELYGAAGHPVATVTHLPTSAAAAAGTTRRGLREPTVLLQDPYLGYEVHVAPEAHVQLLGWIRRASRLDPGAETGGVLLGTRDPATSQVFVTAALGPPPDSTASAEGFICGTEGVRETADVYNQQLRGAASVIGMWHTHPGGPPTPSPTDHGGMGELVEDTGAGPTQLLLIVGGDLTDPTFGAYVYHRDQPRPAYVAVTLAKGRPPAPRTDRVGVALSGGGSRAIRVPPRDVARGLHDLGVLERVEVLSAASGGSVIVAMWAFTDEPFEAFDARVVDLLHRGLTRDIARMTLASSYTLAAAGSALIAGTGATGAAIFNTGARLARSSRRTEPPWRRWVTRTTAFEAVLRGRLFGELTIDQPALARRSGPQRGRVPAEGTRSASAAPRAGPAGSVA